MLKEHPNYIDRHLKKDSKYFNNSGHKYCIKCPYEFPSHQTSLLAESRPSKMMLK